MPEKSSELFDQYKQKFEYLSGWFQLLEVTKVKVLNKEQIHFSLNCSCKSEFEKLRLAVENIDLNPAPSTSNLPPQSKIGENVVSQTQVNKFCKDCIVNGLIPYYHVKSDAFKALVKGLQPTKSVPDYEKVHIMMTEDQNQLIKILLEVLL